jgi:hypothetical protein
MLLFEDYNFAYLHINKTGGSTTKRFLKDVLGENFIHIGLGRRPNMDMPKVHEFLISKIKRFNIMGVDYRNLKILTTIRNPYDRWVSLYTAAVRNVKEGRPNLEARAVYAVENSFDIWLDKYILRGPLAGNEQHSPQTNYLFAEDFYVNKPFVPNNLTVIRLEDLTTDLPQYISKELGITTDLEIPHKNKSSYVREKKNTMDYYPDHLRKLVYNLDKYIIDKYYPEFKY